MLNNWEIIEEHSKPVNWHFDSTEAVSTPLDLCFLKGQMVNFHIPEHQVAIVSTGGETRRVMLEGSHNFFIDEMSSQGLPSDGLVYFINLDKQVPVHFDHKNPLVIPGGVGKDPVLLTGSVACKIENPILFYQTFLQSKICNQDDCSNIIANLLPAWMTIHLAEECGTTASDEELHSAIQKIESSHIDNFLLHHGLSCVEIDFSDTAIKKISDNVEAHLLVT